MGAGRLDNIKVGFIIQARMKSTRLPNKVLMPLPYQGGKPILQWIVDALKYSKFAHQTIVATSDRIENDILYQYCRDNNIECFRGDEENVLSRYISISKAQKFDVIVRLTGDNPLVDIDELDHTIKSHLKHKNDYTKTQGLPIGMNFEILNSKCLIGLDNKILSDQDREHVTSYLRNGEGYKKEILENKNHPDLSALRLTVDYASDYTLLSTLLSMIEKDDFSPLQFVKETFDQCPWLFEANQENIQIQQYETEESEHSAGIALLEKYKLNRLVEKLKSIE